MAFIGQFNAADVEPATPFEVIPAGKYHVQIVRSEMRDTKSGSGQYLWLELSIMDGPYAERRLFERLNLVNQNEKAVEIAHRTLSAICHATGQMSVTESEQLHHKSMVATVKVRAAGPDKSSVMRDASNEIGGYLPMNARSTAPVPPAPVPPVQSAAAVSAGHVEAQPAAGAAKAATPPWRRPTAAA
jgi:Protein of unknown function (DUF669)